MARLAACQVLVFCQPIGTLAFRFGMLQRMADKSTSDTSDRVADPGLALRLYRTAVRLTQMDLAAQAGVSRQAIAMIEASRCTPHPLTRAAISRVLGVPEDRLFPGAEARRD